MKSFFTCTNLFLVALLLGSWGMGLAQSTQPIVDWSTFLAGTASEQGPLLITDDQCNVYFAALVRSRDIITTPDAWQKNNPSATDSYFSTYIGKLSSDGIVEYVSFFGIGGNDAPVLIEQDEDYLYVVGTVTHINGGALSDDFMTTPNNFGSAGSVATNNEGFHFLIKLEKSTMNPVLVTELPGANYFLGGTSNNEAIAGTYDIQIQDGYAYIAGYKRNVGETGNESFVYIIRPDNTPVFISLPNSNIAGQDVEIRDVLVLKNGDVAVYGRTDMPSFSTTDGTTFSGPGDDIFLRRYTRNGTLLFSTLLGGTGNDYFANTSGQLLETADGTLILSGSTDSNNFPFTDGNTASTGNADLFLAGYSPNGTRLFVNGFITNSAESRSVIALHPDGKQVIFYAELNGAVGNSLTITPDAIQATYGGGITDHYIAFVDGLNGAINYATWYGGSGDETTLNSALNPLITTYNTDILFAGTSTGNYPTYPATATAGGYGTFLLLNAAGQLELATVTNIDTKQVYLREDCIYAIGEYSPTYSSFSTFNAVQPQSNAASNTQAVVAKIRRCDGQVAYQSFWGGGESNPIGSFTLSHTTYNGHFVISFCDNTLYATGLGAWAGFSTAFPTTETAHQTTMPTPSASGTALRDMVFFAFDMEADVPWLENSIAPENQTVCINGLATALDGTRVTVDPDSLPNIVRDGVVEAYPEQRAIYQWQVADSPSGPWTDISGGIEEDYLPNVGATTQYYRRIAYNPNSCECNDIISISNIATVTAMPPVAPVADAGLPYRICIGESIEIGGSPTGTPGGDPTLTYEWEVGNTFISNASNPVVMPAATAVYTVTVTDANGCQDLAQTTVTVLTANAGPDQLICGGGPGVQLGTAPIAGLAGVTYNWTLLGGGDASGSLSCTNCPQPIATPTTTTTYTLNVTYPSDAGTSCMLSDNVVVTVDAAPTANFAGPDTYVCLTNTMLTDMASLGTPAQPGFTYTWAPGAYLSATNTSQVTFNAGINLPVPNPITYTLTAVKTATGCVFTDQVKVYGIRADAGDDRCGPKQMGDIKDPYNGQATYTWRIIAGTGGISSDGDCIAEVTGVGGMVTGNNLNLVRAIDSELDNNSTVYELTITFGDPSFQCRDTVEIFHNPCLGCTFDIETVSGNCPVFGAGDTLWLNPVTEFGTPWPREGWNFQWSGPGQILNAAGYTAGLTNPTPGWYYLRLSSIDPIGSGGCDPDNSMGLVSCVDSIYINAANYAFPTYSADNAVICPGDMVMIGSPAVVGYSYMWTDSIDFTSNLAQPQVGPLATTTYYVTVTDINSITPDVPNGCFVVDTVQVLVSDVVAAAGMDRTVCDNALITLGQPDPSGGVWQYEWSPQLANYQNGTTYTDAQPQVLVGGGTQTFSVTVTNPASGCSKTDDVIITVNNNPTILNFPDQTICEGESVKIGAPALPGVTYTWSPTTGLDDANIAQPVANPTATTVYTVTATFPGGCASQPTDMVTVTVNPLPIVNLTDVAICPGVSLLLDGPAGFAAYSWSPSTNMNNKTLENPTVTPAPKTATTYQLRVTNANGCSNTGTMTVTPAVQPNAGQDRILCLGEMIAIGNANNSGLGTITWTGISGAPIGALSATNVASPIFNSAVSGVGTFTYQISINNGMGCTNTDQVTITVQGSTAPILSPTSVCQGGCTTIGTPALPGKIYSWTPTTGLSAPNSSMTQVCPTKTTEYTLVVQDVVTGCVTRSKVTVAVAPTPAPVALNADTMMCLGSELTFNGLTITPPDAGNYSYTWSPTTGLSSPYVANPVISVATNTTYSVTVTDISNGCSDIASVTVDVVDESENPLLIMAVADNLICSNDELAVTATVLNGSANSFQWSSTGDGVIGPNAMSQMITYMLGMQEVANGLANLIITAQGLCSSSVDNVLVSISNPDIDATPVGSPITCDVEEGTITVTASGGVGALQYSIDNGQTWQYNHVFTAVPPGSYLLQIRDTGLMDCMAQTVVYVPPYDCAVTQPAGVTFD